MKIPSALNGPLGWALVIAVGGGLIYLIGRKIITGGVAAIADVNKGTAYEGAGVVGTIGNAANTASGGVLEDIGSWVGGTIFDWTHDEYDPNAPTPPLRSRKQAVGDQFYDTGGRVLQ